MQTQLILIAIFSDNKVVLQATDMRGRILCIFPRGFSNAYILDRVLNESVVCHCL
jgi:hypothetical protein